MYKLKRDAEAAKATHSEKYALYKDANYQVMMALEGEGMSTFDSESCKISLIEKSSAKFPKDNIVAKRLLYKYISTTHGEDALLEMTSIHSGKFNTFYNEEEGIATGKGEFDFSMPGVDAPKPYNEIRVRKK